MELEGAIYCGENLVHFLFYEGYNKEVGEK